MSAIIRSCSAAGRKIIRQQNLVVAGIAFLNLNSIIIDPILFLYYIRSYTRSHIRIEAINKD